MPTSAENDTRESDRVLSYHLVGFFDVLGKSSRLSHLTRLPETEEERATTIRLLKQTVGTVVGVRRMFRDFFNGMDAPTPFALSLPASQRRQVVDATRASLIHWGVSDSVIVAVSLLESEHPCTPVNGVYRAFLAAAGMWLLSLSVNHPLRGGLEVGLAMPISGREVYGPALDRAYRLESQVAGGPRIVVGTKCVDYLNAQRQRRQSDDVREQLAAGVAEFCLSMLRQDSDGVTVLDVLGSRMREMADTMKQIAGESISDRVGPAHDAVRQQLVQAEATNDEKLAARYRQLLAYFDDRAPIWT